MKAKYHLSLCLSLISSLTLLAQQAQPLPGKVLSTVYLAAADSSRYAFHSGLDQIMTGTSFDEIFLADSAGYVKLLYPSQLGSPEALEFIDGELYVASSLAAFGTQPDRSFLVKHNAGSWLVLDSVLGLFKTGTMHQGSWYLGGAINDPGRQLNCVVRWTANGLVQGGNLISADTISSLQSLGGELWATGQFHLGLPSDTAHLMMLSASSNTWTTPVKEVRGFNPNGGLPKWLFKNSFRYGNKNYLIRDSTIYELRADSLVFVHHLNLNLNTQVDYNIGTVDFKGKVYLNAGKRIVEFDGSTFKSLNPGLQNNVITKLVVFQDEIYGAYQGPDTLAGVAFGGTFSWNPIGGLERIDHPKTQFNIYPNPSGEWITIRGEESFNEVSIFSLGGQRLKTWSFTDTLRSPRLSIATLPKGLYLVQVGNQKIKVLKS